MSLAEFSITERTAVGGAGLPLIIAGPCVAESLEICRTIAGKAQAVCQKLGFSYVFKASFDKANRTSINSFRGGGMEEGLAILAAIKEEFSCPVLTDVHEPGQCAAVAEVADILQIPAFLCRQTDLLLAAGNSGRAVNIKKGQFLAPEDMASVVHKVESTGNQRILLTERGSCFGYHNLVVDMRSLVIMRNLGCPVVFDATHSVQIPGGQGTSSGGRREFVFPLVRAAAAIGIDALFLETHPDPDHALSDGPNSVDLAQLETILSSLKDIDETVKRSAKN
ncbi:MAG: 3-deoxy-8-phosphooctulonate synthase [Lentisphaerae bacterium]|jgi:2-dehydro-3-deoxyphosphooctonate aldolase (KDO 8-P synthase)|nr:3-deoxy-8-phosphooctulonate synthase [Lentisphaerota bacterium]